MTDFTLAMCNVGHDHISYSNEIACPLCKEMEEHLEEIDRYDEKIAEFTLIVEKIKKVYPEYLV